MVLLTSACTSTDRRSVAESKSSPPTAAVAPDAREAAPAQSEVSVDTATIPESDWLSKFSVEASGGNKESVPLPDLHPIARRSVVYRNAWAPTDLTTPVRPRARPVPAYPYALCANHIDGTVLLSLVVSPDGTVGRADILEATNQMLAEAAGRAVVKWLFVPGQKNGQAVASVAIVPMSFHADD